MKHLSTLSTNAPSEVMTRTARPVPVVVMSVCDAFLTDVQCAAERAGLGEVRRIDIHDCDEISVIGKSIVVLDPDALDDPVSGASDLLDRPSNRVVLFGKGSGLIINRHAIRRVVDRDMGLDVLAMALRSVVTDADKVDKACIPKLSARERQALHLYGRGFTLKEIAQRLGISDKSVETYKGRACRKLGLNGRAEVLSYIEPFLTPAAM